MGEGATWADEFSAIATVVALGLLVFGLPWAWDRDRARRLRRARTDRRRQAWATARAIAVEADELATRRPHRCEFGLLRDRRCWCGLTWRDLCELERWQVLEIVRRGG